VIPAAATGVGTVAPTIPSRRRRALQPDRAGWPIWLFTGGLPLAFAVGVHGIAWLAPALVLGARVLATPSVRFPRSSIPLVAFVGWSLLSLSTIDPGDLPIFFYRWLLFAGALAVFVWLVNVSEEAVPTARVVDWLAAMWICLMVFGYLATLFPNLIVPSPLGLVFRPLQSIPFLARISEWRFAETHKFMGYPVPRPAAPFGAANSWGSAVGILTPFFLRSWFVDADAKRRRKGVALLLFGIYPVLVSVNRGLWMALIIAFVYFAARKALRGRFTAVAVLVAAVVATAALFVLTPAGGLVADRLDNSEKSNAARSNLYELAWQGAKASPLVGNGVPHPVPNDPDSPPIGTHGLIWYLMYIHGFPGLVLFLGWLTVEVFRSGRVRSTLGWWTHLSLVIAFVEVPYYGLLPHVILIGIAAGLAHREQPA
jgi:hypothetical protein